MFTILDWISLVLFVAGWILYSFLIERSHWRALTLTAAMNRQRVVWMETMLAREVRIVDTSIVAGLQNGTAFFASTSLLAIGSAFALMNAADLGIELARHLPGASQVTRDQWELKALGLMGIYGYAFFKFGWSYRLFNYASILMGAMPPASERDTEDARIAARRAGAMNAAAGRHFNRGLRAFFFSVGYLGWFASDWAFLVLTLVVLAVLVRRQLGSEAARIARLGDSGLDA
ncbi:DUF599 domain-containing protein [Propylenella binzhouense]|uniref:DUF599 domain-containing protein n=1 Tax=Propylenella binzhouense TaxID=2555902 RepID=UPI0031B577E1